MLSSVLNSDRAIDVNIQINADICEASGNDIDL